MYYNLFTISCAHLTNVLDHKLLAVNIFCNTEEGANIYSTYYIL